MRRRAQGLPEVPSGSRWRAATATLVFATLALSGCATAPPADTVDAAKAPAASSAAAADVSKLPPTCPACVDQSREVARLKQELALREAEVRELRTQQREQVKIVQESARQVTRARVKLRRLATQADAASYLAEVEVALQSLRALPRARSSATLIGLAQALLDSANPPFDHGEYGLAIDRAVQAEELITAVSDHLRSSVNGSGEVPLFSPLALQLSADATLRRNPMPRAASAAVMKKGTPLIAYAFRDDWMQVRTEEGRLGWVEQKVLIVP